MTGEKLYARGEEWRWKPPVLTFKIERHGGAGLGSSRAEVHTWGLNLKTLEAGCDTRGRRQLRPMDKRLDVKPLAKEIAELIVNRKPDRRLHQCHDGKVQVLIKVVIPETFKQTTVDRRKRFRNELKKLLADKGWEQTSPNFYRPMSDSGAS